jgi:hypothetical protein
MPEAMRTCPECRTRVLPTAEGLCPACRKHRFGPTSDVRAAAAVKEATAREAKDLRAAVVLYWRTWKLAAFQWVLVGLYFGLGWVWPGPKPEADPGFSSARIAIVVAAVGVGVALFFTTRRLAEWLDPKGGTARPLASAIPGGNVVALLQFTKEIASEFEDRGLAVRGLGPRLRDLPPG